MLSVLTTLDNNGFILCSKSFLNDGVCRIPKNKEDRDKFETYKQCRRLEKLIDELAKGRKMEKILRKEKN